MSTPVEAFRAAVIAGFPNIETSYLVHYRVVRTDADRLSLQKVNTRDNAPDMIPVEVWPGVPGATSTPTPGEIVIVAFVGVDQYPTVIGRAPKGEAGDVPLSVLFDATRGIDILTRPESGPAQVSIGLTPTSLAKYSGVASLYSALVAFSTTLQGSADPTVAAAAVTLSAALAGITIAPTTKLVAT